MENCCVKFRREFIAQVQWNVCIIDGLLVKNKKKKSNSLSGKVVSRKYVVDLQGGEKYISMNQKIRIKKLYRPYPGRDLPDDDDTRTRQVNKYHLALYSTTGLYTTPSTTTSSQTG